MTTSRRPALLLLLAATSILPLTTQAAATDAGPRTPLAVQSRAYDLVSRVENLAGTERVSESKTETTYSLQAAVLFAKDSADISAQAQQKIDDIAQKIAQAHPGRAVEIHGYTDNLGSAEHGLELSEDRANAVKRLLTKNPVLRQITFTAKGLGEAEPIADNSSENGRQKNRRVEIVVPAR
ncbi:OmpA family protein [[Kitasatospora] papulosa]|uniref:OmpA family protein n=1 Tax=[Kitasatospora] papulosa TaxID=1464011 RepID=UPI00364065BF